MSSMTLDPADMLMMLRILISIMMVVVFYHLFFIVVDVRKIVRRIQHVTEEVENTIMKPISMADTVVEWTTKMIADQQKRVTRSKKEKKSESQKAKKSK